MCVLDELYLGYLALLWVLPTLQSFFCLWSELDIVDAITKVVISMCWNRSVDLILIGDQSEDSLFSLTSNHRIINFYRNQCRSRVHIECVHLKSPTKGYLALLPWHSQLHEYVWPLDQIEHCHIWLAIVSSTSKSTIVIECYLGSMWRCILSAWLTFTIIYVDHMCKFNAYA